MNNYIGYFRSLEQDHLYSVKLTKDSGNPEYTEILLADDQPFVVSYQQSQTPFDAVRKSTAVIRVVRNDYLADILTPYAQAVKVELTDETTHIIEWTGFINPRVFDASYVNEYETFDLEAADCVSSLQYVDFEQQVSGTPQLITIKSILEQVCNKCKNLKGFYWTKSKHWANNNLSSSVLYPTSLKISEENFYSSDTIEPWKLSEVLEEVCKYLGFTAVQWREYLYLVDYQYFHNNNRLDMARCDKANGYNNFYNETLDEPFYLSQDNIRGAGHTISYEPVYNKIKVKDNFYNIDEIIPNIFDDAYLTNRNGDFYANYEVLPEADQKGFQPYDAQHKYTVAYPAGSNIAGVGQGYKWEKFDDKDQKNELIKDNRHRYFKRNYDHKYWKSLYYNKGGSTPLNLTEAQLSGNTCMRDYVGGTITDMGVVRKNYVSEYQQYMIPNKLDYTRYICLCLKPVYGQADVPLMQLSGYTLTTTLPVDSYLVFNFTGIYERYEERAYINTDWLSDSCKGAFFDPGEWYAGGVKVRFKLKVGNKWWNGREWQAAETAFGVATERTSDQFDTWNTEESTLNNISWDMFINEEGYKVPLYYEENGVKIPLSICDDLRFEILRPTKNWYHEYPAENIYVWQWNAYYWIKDFSVKVVCLNQDKEREDSDVVYETIIDDDAVSELSDIEVKITTSVDAVKPAWSNMILYTGGTNTLLSAITEPSLYDYGETMSALTPEENICLKYYKEYSTPTAKFSMDVQPDQLTPFTKVFNVNVNADQEYEGYVPIGSEIDYREYKQSLKLVHIK